MYVNLLRFRASRYLWMALALVALSVLLFALHSGLTPRGGDTWEGYTLGTIGTLLILWLTALGVRKRSYSSSLGTVEGWTSAHVYLGLALLVIATLHCAGRFGWNVHTLAYALMAAVILSGVIGVSLYLLAPSYSLNAREDRSQQELFTELRQLDATVRNLAGRCRLEIAVVTQSALERTVLGGGVFDQLLRLDRSRMLLAAAGDSGPAALVANHDQQAVLDYVSGFLPRPLKSSEVSTLQEMIALLGRRQVVLRQLRRDVCLGSWLTLWLYVHVPLTFALLAALTVHIIVTFLYW
jgi:hypothetical protein